MIVSGDHDVRIGFRQWVSVALEKSFSGFDLAKTIKNIPKCPGHHERVNLHEPIPHIPSLSISILQPPDATWNFALILSDVPKTI